MQKAGAQPAPSCLYVTTPDRLAPASGAYAQYVPVRIAPSRCAPSSRWCRRFGDRLPDRTRHARHVHARTPTRLAGRGHRGRRRVTARVRGSRVRTRPARPARCRRARAPARCRRRSRRGAGGTPPSHVRRAAGRHRRVGARRAGRRLDPPEACPGLSAATRSSTWNSRPGSREEPREVAHALQVPHPQRAPLERERPVVALATRDTDVRRPAAGRPRDVDPPEDGARRSQLQVGQLLAAVGRERVGEAHAGERRLVRRADIVPESRRFREELFRRLGIALGEAYPPSREGRARDERLAVESVGDDLQLVGGRAGSIDLAGRDLDLDLRLEQRRPPQLRVRWQLLRRDTRGRSSASRMKAAAAATSPCASSTSARPGCGSQPARARPATPARRRRGRPSAAGSARARSAAIRARVAGTGGARRTPRAPRCSASSHEPRSLRISARWTRQRPCRLPTAFVLHHRSIASVHSSASVVLCEPLQRAHELAVDEAGRERIELARDHRHTRVVEERQPSLHVAAQDEEPCLCHAADGAAAGSHLSPISTARRAHSRAFREVARQQSLVAPGRPRTRRAPTSPPGRRAGAPRVPASRAPEP